MFVVKVVNTDVSSGIYDIHTDAILCRIIGDSIRSSQLFKLDPDDVNLIRYNLCSILGVEDVQVLTPYHVRIKIGELFLWDETETLETMQHELIPSEMLQKINKQYFIENEVIDGIKKTINELRSKCGLDTYTECMRFDSVSIRRVNSKTSLLMDIEKTYEC